MNDFKYEPLHDKINDMGFASAQSDQILHFPQGKLRLPIESTEKTDQSGGQSGCVSLLNLSHSGSIIISLLNIEMIITDFSMYTEDYVS